MAKNRAGRDLKAQPITQTREQIQKRLSGLKTELDRANLDKLINLSVEYLKNALVAKKVLAKDKIDIAKSIVAKAMPRDAILTNKAGGTFLELIKELHAQPKKVVNIQQNINVGSKEDLPKETVETLTTIKKQFDLKEETE